MNGRGHNAARRAALDKPQLARKNTTAVVPMRTVSIALLADHPGIWMLHCHNTYHHEAGMVTSLNHTS